MSDAGYGVGAYSLAEAGKLLGIPAATIRHWLFGYSYDHHGPRVRQQPLWRPQYGVDQDEPLLGFRDLLEARIVRGLRAHKIGLQTIRECLRYAAELADDEHPFSSRQFRTDGHKLFLASKDGKLLDLKVRQLVFNKVVEPSFVDLDFDADVASRWWLSPNRRTIVLDPARAFGQPIEAATGVPTRRLAQAVAAEGSVERVARLYEIKPAAVRDAIAFERRQSGKLAA